MLRESAAGTYHCGGILELDEVPLELDEVRRMAVEFGDAGVFRKAIAGGLFPGGWKDIPEEERKRPFVREVARKMRLCGTPRKLRLGEWSRATLAGMQRLRIRQSDCPNQSFRSLLAWLCSESRTRRNLEVASECGV